MAFYRPASWQKPLSLLLLCAALALPSALAAFGQEFYIGFATRVLIFALAASSLNLVLGFGGMVSLGHAAFLGAGAYAAAICQQAGINEALLAFPAAMGIAGLFALVVGAISLRTRGVYFIMITLAFAQMAYYLFISARSWGGDDGLPLNGRMTGRLQPGRRRGAVLCRSRTAGPRHAVFGRLAEARFGRTLQAIRENETRMEALGYPVFATAWSLALGGAVAGLAGALLANLTGLASPNLLQWTQSGTLLVMVIIGGVGYLYGGVVGAAVLLLLEESLVGVTEHWHIILGLLLLAVVLFAPKGVAALFGKRHG
jgi:branched-chain amino acid transport system permease protein